MLFSFSRWLEASSVGRIVAPYDGEFPRPDADAADTREGDRRDDDAAAPSIHESVAVALRPAAAADGSKSKEGGTGRIAAAAPAPEAPEPRRRPGPRPSTFSGAMAAMDLEGRTPLDLVPQARHAELVTAMSSPVDRGVAGRSGRTSPRERSGGRSGGGSASSPALRKAGRPARTPKRTPKKTSRRTHGLGLVPSPVSSRGRRVSEAARAAESRDVMEGSDDDSSWEEDREPLPYLQRMREETEIYFARMKKKEWARKFASRSDAGARDGAEGNDGGMF
ncbi:hypothetical protein ACHAWF_001873 [Thalassiosira exigua]